MQVVKTWPHEGEKGLMREVVVKAYVESLEMIWVVMCVLAGVAFLCSLIWIKEISLNRELETEQAFIHDRKAASLDEENSKTSSL